MEFFSSSNKILPAVSKIIIHFNKLKYAEAAALKIAADIENYNNLFASKKGLIDISFKDSIELNNVSFSYKNRDRNVLDK